MAFAIFISIAADAVISRTQAGETVDFFIGALLLSGSDGLKENDPVIDGIVVSQATSGSLSSRPAKATFL
jgi:hypothetical protein